MLKLSAGELNMHRVLDAADSIDRAEGLEAYAAYRSTMEGLSARYGFTLNQTTAAFVALSPNNDYKGNLKSLVTVLHGISEGWALDEFTVTTYRACFLRAHAYASGELDFMAHSRGPKTRAFYRNILDPGDRTPVTVDGHMMGIWVDRRMKMVDAIRAGVSYDVVAHGIRSVAFARCLIPNQVQATLWFAWKRMHRVVYQSQLGLFDEGNHWGAYVEADAVRPFPRRVGGSL